MSEQTEWRPMDRIVGHGWVSRDGVRLGDVEYRIAIWQQFIISEGIGRDGPHEHAGMQQLRLSLTPPDAFADPRQPNPPMTLHLHDGRTVDLVFDGTHFLATSPLR